MTPVLLGAQSGVITIGIDPNIQIGPLTLTWHGLTLAVGILAGLGLAVREARRRGIDPDPLTTIAGIVVVSALVGGRLWFLAETDPSALLRPGDWLGTNGFTFYGGFIMAAVGIAAYLRLTRRPPLYLDLIAAALPLGVAIGRVGDVINGEHYGPRSDWLLAVRNSHPDALTPDSALAYHSGGLYEVILGLVIFAIVWPLRGRFSRPLTITWLVIGLFGIGRFIEFFAREDSEDVALGLNPAQWASLALIAAAISGSVLTARHYRRRADGALPAARST